MAAGITEGHLVVPSKTSVAGLDKIQAIRAVGTIPHEDEFAIEHGERGLRGTGLIQCALVLPGCAEIARRQNVQAIVSTAPAENQILIVAVDHRWTAERRVP